MYLREFPDINWLRLNAKQNFQHKRDLFGKPLANKGWPNVIMNTKTSNTERDDILGPFSIFCNVSGNARVKVNNNWFSVNPDVYCLSNKGQAYDLHIPKFEKVETFNIHFGEELYNDVINVLSHKQSTLMDYAAEGNLANFELLPKSGWMSSDLSLKINHLYRYCQTSNCDYSPDIEYELMSGILALVLNESMNKLKRIEWVSALKLATKTELFRRAGLAIDFMHENIFKEVHLDELSSHCGLSKFHLLRVFKEVYGYTPREYMASLRLEKAKELILKTNLPLSDIALMLGFSELSAFTRFFTRHTYINPSQLRG